MNERLGIRLLIILGIIVLGIWAGRELWVVISQFGTVLALFFLAWLISFILSPPTNVLTRRGLSRPVAVFAVYSLVLVILTVGFVLLTPIVAGQIGELIEMVNSYTAQTPGLLIWAEEQARGWGVSEAEIRNFYWSLIDQLRNVTGVVLQNALLLLTGAASLLVNVVFCLIISVYLMLDGRRIVAGALQLTPQRYRREVSAILQSIDANFGGYIRGQLILALMYAIGISLVMIVADLRFMALSSIFAGIAMIIPFIGPFISIVPPILVALLTAPNKLWWVVLLLVVMQQVVLNVAAPRIFGRTVQMHPLLVIAAAMGGAAVAGVWGALFGIPVVGIIASVVRRYLAVLQQSDAEASAEQASAAAVAATPPDAADLLATPSSERSGGPH